MYRNCFSSAGRGNGRGAMPFVMSFALDHGIVTLTWIDNVSVQFPLNIYATKGYIQISAIRHARGIVKYTKSLDACKTLDFGREYNCPYSFCVAGLRVGQAGQANSTA